MEKYFDFDIHNKKNMSDDYQIQNVYKYSRKTYKDIRQPQDDPAQDETNVEAERSPRSHDIREMAMPGCSCDLHSEAVANILHKKCPVITLAQHQLQKLLEGTDKILCENSTCRNGSIYDFLCICRDVLMTQNKCMCALFMIIGMAFALGVLIGAASCGTHLGTFNSPILTCFDNFFISEPGYKLQEYRGIV